MQARSQTFFEFNVSDMLLGTHENVEPGIEIMVTIDKMLLYYCKVNNIKLKLQCYIKRVEDTHNIEKYIAVKNKTKSNAQQKWVTLSNVEQDVINPS